MGADLLITALVIERDRAPDFDAARKAIESVRSEDVMDPDEFWGDDPETAEGIDAIRQELRDAVTELETALQGSRELGWLHIRGATVYLTGGLSTGDAPTELFETFNRLWAVPSVPAAAGFEVAS